jgi:hypothetical protein
VKAFFDKKGIEYQDFKTSYRNSWKYYFSFFLIFLLFMILALLFKLR